MVFKFKVRVAAYDPEGYYLTDWAKAVAGEVVAPDKDVARQKAIAAMGKPPSQRQWAAIVDIFEEVAPEIRPYDEAVGDRAEAYCRSFGEFAPRFPATFRWQHLYESMAGLPLGREG
jgi:hypothetical protein